MSLADKISLFYFFFGLLFTAFIAIISYKTQLINKKTELLYLNTGFYIHFIKIYFGNFFSSLNIIFLSCFFNKSLNPVIKTVDLNKENQRNDGLLVTSINMTSGLFCVNINDKEVSIHCIDEKYFKKFNLEKTLKSLAKINEHDSI